MHEAPPPANPNATTAPEKAATELKDKASAAHEKQQYGESFSLWNQAYALEPLPSTAYNIACAAARMGQTDAAFEWLHAAIDHGFSALSWLGDPDLQSLKADPRWAKLPERMRPLGEARNKENGLGSGLPRTTADAAGLDPAALAALLKEAEKSHTTGLVVLRDGKLAGDWYFGNWSRPIEAMSATKSVVALAFGFLLDDGKLKSLDEPLWHFFPELRQGLKEKLTVRHVLTHTSGVQALNDTTDIYRASDFVRLALAADLEAEPGTQFRYNNKAVNLLAGVVERASGQKLDAYLTEKLFAPLGIKDVQWTKDKAGNPHAMSGLQIHPLDLAKVGQLVLDGGRWNGKSLLSAAYLEDATRKSATPLQLEHGYLWWLTWEKNTRELPPNTSRSLAARNVNPAWVKAVKAVEGKPMDFDAFWNELAVINDKDAFVAELEKAGTPLRRTVSGLRSSEARGYLGQYLLIYPAQRLVVVRMAETDDAVSEEVLSSASFGALAGKLTTKN